MFISHVVAGWYTLTNTFWNPKTESSLPFYNFQKYTQKYEETAYQALPYWTNTKKPEVWSVKFHPFQNEQCFWEEIKNKLKFIGSVRRQHQVNAPVAPCSYRG